MVRGCAKNVWFEIARGLDGKGYPTGIILELPDKKNQAGRDECFKTLKEYYKGIGVTGDPKDTTDTGQRYISIIIL